jgi:hypothetical protein
VLGDDHLDRVLHRHRVVMIFPEAPEVVEAAEELDAAHDITMKVSEGDRSQTADQPLRPPKLPRQLLLTLKLRLSRKMAGALFLSRRRITVVAIKVPVLLLRKY